MRHVTTLTAANTNPVYNTEDQHYRQEENREPTSQDPEYRSNTGANAANARVNTRANPTTTITTASTVFMAVLLLWG